MIIECSRQRLCNLAQRSKFRFYILEPCFTLKVCGMQLWDNVFTIPHQLSNTMNDAVRDM